MKNIISQAEIVFWDAAITLMSREKTPRMYSQTVAAMTLCLRPGNPNLSFRNIRYKVNIRPQQWVRLGIISLTSLILGLLLGWLRTG